MVASVAGLGIPVLDGMDTVLHTTLILPYRNTLKGIYAYDHSVAAYKGSSAFLYGTIKILLVVIS